MHSTPLVWNRGRARAVALGSVLMFALGAAAGSAGCGSQARATQAEVQAAAAPQPVMLPPQPAAGQVVAPAPPPPLAPGSVDVPSLADRVKPMVVNITTTQTIRGTGFEGIDPFELFFGGPPGSRRAPERAPKRSAAGTGFIIDPAGYVVTNEHVVRNADEVRVRLADERELAGEVVGRDPKLDLALLKLEGARELPAVPLGSSEQLRVGEWVLAVGNPFGLGHTVTVGIVSAKARAIGAGPYDDFIQTDASINPGNSGGPLFNMRGEVVGINTAIRAGANGIGFAIPVDALKDVLPQLRDKGHVERGKLGLLFQQMTPDLAKALGLPAQRGALVAEVEPGGPAAKAGIKPGDVIVSVNQTPINHAEELPRNVARHAPGSTIKLTLLRGTQQHEVTARLAPLQDDEDEDAPRRGGAPSKQDKGQTADKLGIAVSDAPGGGVRVDGLTEDSRIDDLRRGDVILEMNGEPVKNVEGMRVALAKVKPGTVALLKVRRGKLTRFVGAPIPAK